MVKLSCPGKNSVFAVQPWLKFFRNASAFKRGDKAVKYQLSFKSGLTVLLFTGVLLTFALSQPVLANNDLDLDSFFNLEQEAGTQEGVTKRYIDVSSPWSGAYLYENMVVEGKAEIKESFSMNNIKPGSGSGSEDSGSQGSGKESTAGQQDSNNKSTGYVNDGGSSTAVDIPRMEDGSVKSSSVGTSSDPSDQTHPVYGSNPGPGNDSLYFRIPQWSDLF